MTAAEAEAALASLLMSYAGPRPWEHRHPLVTLQALSLLHKLPVLVYRPSESRAGQAITGRLRRSSLGVVTPLHEAMPLLELPCYPAPYDHGHDRATQRRHARKALKAGVTWIRVRDPAERERLMLVYRAARVRMGDDDARDWDLGYLRACDLWFDARHRGRPILLSTTAIDGEWAMMFCFSNLAAGPVVSATRYLMTGVLAVHLAS